MKSKVWCVMAVTNLTKLNVLYTREIYCLKLQHFTEMQSANPSTWIPFYAFLSRHGSILTWKVLWNTGEFSSHWIVSERILNLKRRRIRSSVKRRFRKFYLIVVSGVVKKCCKKWSMCSGEFLFGSLDLFFFLLYPSSLSCAISLESFFRTRLKGTCYDGY